MKRLGAVLASIFSVAFTANGYRPLSKGGYGSVFAFADGVFASELPLQSLGVQLTALAALSRRLPPRLRRFSWLLTAVSGLGLLGLRRLGHRANEPLTAALDAGLGKPLWHFQMGAAVYASPMAFAVDGKQYVAIAAGSSLYTFGLP